MNPADMRERIVTAAIGILRAQGLAGLTQPRVAKAAGLSQSHLTYYFPTRADLVRGVLEAAVAGQEANLGGAMTESLPYEERIARLVRALANTENTRVLVSLVLAADAEPTLRDLYHRLVVAMRKHSAALLASAGLEATPAQVALLHALGTGLAIIGVALGSKAGRTLNAQVLDEMFRLFATAAEE